MIARPACRFAWSGALASSLALAAMLPGCRSGAPDRARSWATCTCSYVTDMDQPGTIRFDVCGEADQRIGMAENCARGAGIGAVERCVCRSPSGTSCSDRDTCRDVETGR